MSVVDCGGEGLNMDEYGLGCCFLNQDLQDYEDLQDWDNALRRFHPHLSPLPSRERGILAVVLSCSPMSPSHPVDTTLKPV